MAKNPLSWQSIFLARIDHRLPKIQNSIYLNNSDEYLSVAANIDIQLLGVGNDCGVQFVQRHSTTMTSTTKAAGKRGRKKCAANQGHPTNILDGVDCTSWWINRVQQIRKKQNQRWVRCMQPIDLLNR